jgi:hypothetical protein
MPRAGFDDGRNAPAAPLARFCVMGGMVGGPSFRYLRQWLPESLRVPLSLWRWLLGKELLQVKGFPNATNLSHYANWVVTLWG